MLKKVLIYLLPFVFLFSCERKPLYLLGDAALRLNIQVEADINVLWDEHGEDTLKYDWDEEKYGPIGYTLPENCNVIMFNDGNIVSQSTIKRGKRQTINAELNNTYDILIYSKENFWVNEYYEGGRYYVEAPSAEEQTNSKNEISAKYETVNQPGEIFAVGKKGIFLSDDISEYEEIIEDGKPIYVYNIDENLSPASYIYIVQFIVINDDNSPMIEAKDIANFTISGISNKKNLFSNEAIYTGYKQISTYDIKPGQQHTDSLIFASRITIIDLLPNDKETSWESEIKYLYYTNIDIDTYNYGEVTGTKNITKQLKDNPKGGVITIIILNSELKQGGETGSGFGIDLSEWEEYRYNVD